MGSKAAPRVVDGGALTACPFLRLEAEGQLLLPGPTAAYDHRCIAIAGPRVVSSRQQELVCLRDAFIDCPRYRRAPASRSPRLAFRPPAIPRAIAASLAVLALSAGISFGFVLQRGGIDLPSTLAASTAAAAVGSGSASAPTPSAPAASAPPSTSAAPSAAGSPAAATPGSPNGASSAPPAASPTPATTPAAPTASPAASSSGPSADRLAVISPCAGQPGCWIYHVRAGDNLWSIAHWFGIPLDTVYAWNPVYKTKTIRAGDALRIPTPTR